MSLLLIFGYLAFTAVMLFLMISPFLGGRRGNVRAEHLDEEVRELEQLVTRRHTLLAALRELEFEHETGKSATADYERFKKRYEREAVAILRRLDELHGGRGWEERIDRELEERLGRKPRIAEEVQAAEQAPTEEAQPEDAQPQEAEPEAPDEGSDACPACGETIEANDVFCSRCGTRLDASQSVAAEDEQEAKAGANP